MVAEAPAWVLEKLVKWMRAFFWAGKKDVNGGQCLVAWDTICKPTRLGGLGVKDLRLQGLALRVRWCWLRRTDPSRPWQGLPALNDTEANEVFQSLAIFRVGDGESTLFWTDRWIDGRSAGDIAPEVTALVPTRRRNSRKIRQALQEEAWLSDIVGDLSIEGWMQCTLLWEAIEGVPRDDDTCYGRRIGGLGMVCRDNPDPALPVCGEEDTVDHILSHCPYARMVWFGCLTRLGSQLQVPQENTNLERWWTEARKRLRREDRREFDTLVLLIAWTLWKQRNARVFGNLERQLSTEQTIDSVLEEFALWRAARGGEWRIMPRE
ncbi:uncharacterized protein [Lolium perenne]|uniref:uncharacterized protein n=1 Tax=Lolium perenne TaxID=4522 RepID=UPI003A9958BD